MFSFLFSVPKLVDLVNELNDVNNWIAFGLNLDIEIERLREIEKECATVQECRIKMLEVWQNNVIPTWSAVVDALLATGRKLLASRLAQKHGEFNTSYTTNVLGRMHLCGVVVFRM